MKITVVLGTARTGRMSEHVAASVVEALEQEGVAATLVDVKEHVTSLATVPPWGVGGADEVPTKWKTIVAETDTFVMVLPEYNHSYPGEWKLLMDSLYGEYAGKRCYVVAVGGGVFAGARVMEHVMPVLVNFQFQIGNARLHVGNISKLYNETGTLTSEDMSERITKFAQDIIANK